MISFPTTLIKDIEGYLLTNIEYKIITDFNLTADDHKSLTCIKYGTKWILEKNLAHGILSDSYWEKWHSIVQARIENKTVGTYTVDFLNL